MRRRNFSFLASLPRGAHPHWPAYGAVVPVVSASAVPEATGSTCFDEVATSVSSPLLSAISLVFFFFFFFSLVTSTIAAAASGSGFFFFFFSFVSSSSGEATTTVDVSISTSISAASDFRFIFFFFFSDASPSASPFSTTESVISTTFEVSVSAASDFRFFFFFFFSFSSSEVGSTFTSVIVSSDSSFFFFFFFFFSFFVSSSLPDPSCLRFTEVSSFFVSSSRFTDSAIRSSDLMFIKFFSTNDAGVFSFAFPFASSKPAAMFFFFSKAFGPRPQRRGYVSRSMMTRRYSRCTHESDARSDRFTFCGHHDDIVVEVDTTLVPKNTRQHQLCSVTYCVDTRVLNDETFVRHEESLQWLHDTTQVRLIIRVIVHPLCVHDVVHRHQIVVLVLNARAYTTQLLHVSAHAEYETEMHTQRTHIRSRLTRHPEHRKVTLLIPIEKFVLVDGTHAKFTFHCRDEWWSLKERTR